MIKVVRKLTVKTTYKKSHIQIVLKGATPFQKKVWRVLQTIPCGETRTYKWVAQKIGKPRAVRAVGQACGANPLPLIIPCHRVVASGGKLGGFSLGIAMKKRLLKWEGSL